MITSISDWLFFLKVSGHAIGFPLVGAGLGLMLLGWRVWRVCVLLSFALIGALFAAWLAGPCDEQWLYALGGGALLGLLSYKPVTLAVSLLGGLIGGALVMQCLSSIGLSGLALWVSGAAALIACTAVSFLNRQHVVVIVTAFLGAALLLSGVAAWVMHSPGFFDHLRTMATDSVIVLPFLLLVPTIMSSFYQFSEVHRAGKEI